MTLNFRIATCDDIQECITIRGSTRDNAISAARLAELGVTHLSWSQNVADEKLSGVVCLELERIVGHCFADPSTGEIVVLAVLPDWEGKGVGKRLLEITVRNLWARGHRRLFLAASPKTQYRSHGFYRHLGWKPSGRTHANQDEELEYFPSG